VLQLLQVRLLAGLLVVLRVGQRVELLVLVVA